MTSFFATLHGRNAVLYQIGWFSIVGMLVCAALAFTTQSQVLGINAYIKPMKFFGSIAILSWTMAWFVVLLSQQRSVQLYAWVIVVVFTFEMGVIVWQARQSKLSHFNISSPTDGLLFNLMGLAITVFTVWTAYIGYLFFRLDTTTANAAYIWGIRLGILLFVIFAFEGFMMASRLAHTVGAPDGGPARNELEHGLRRFARGTLFRDARAAITSVVWLLRCPTALSGCCPGCNLFSPCYRPSDAGFSW